MADSLVAASMGGKYIMVIPPVAAPGVPFRGLVFLPSQVLIKVEKAARAACNRAGSEISVPGGGGLLAALIADSPRSLLELCVRAGEGKFVAGLPANEDGALVDEADGLALPVR